MLALSTTEIIGLFAGSSVLAAFVNQGIGAFRDRRKLKREAAFSALYVAIALEDYASTCSSLISDSENHDASDGNAGAAHGNVAELPAFPASVEWKQFGIKSTTDAMSLRVDVDNTRAMIRGLWDFDDEDRIVPLVKEESARLGLDAICLAIALRRDWKLARVEYGPGWSVKAHLEERLKRYTDQREQFEAQNIMMAEDLLAIDPPEEAASKVEPAP